MIEALVRREGGAVIADLTAATGWQEHSVRAALTGLRKAGHTISRDRDADGTMRYRVAGAV
jgi:DNA-binding transcriptional regulator PaaX